MPTQSLKKYIYTKNWYWVNYVVYLWFHKINPVTGKIEDLHDCNNYWTGLGQQWKTHPPGGSETKLANGVLPHLVGAELLNASKCKLNIADRFVTKSSKVTSADFKFHEMNGIKVLTRILLLIIEYTIIMQVKARFEWAKFQNRHELKFWFLDVVGIIQVFNLRFLICPGLMKTLPQIALGLG